jgi:hypothetical protein
LSITTKEGKRISGSHVPKGVLAPDMHHGETDVAKEKARKST